MSDDRPRAGRRPSATTGEERALDPANRPLTGGERASLSPGLWEALERAGASPRIIPRAHWMARVSRLWRGHTPILTLYDEIYWPEAPGDLSASGRQDHLATLQHELQHVLEFATGRLSLAGYGLDPRNWRYRYRLRPGQPFEAYGAEQRASIAEDLWRTEHGLPTHLAQLAEYRSLIPWAK